MGDRYGAYNSIGGGTYSRTYLAIDTHKVFDPRCIIKGFVYQADQAERAMEVFRREAEILDDLGQHPQIPDLYAYFERGIQQYLVQEFVDGRNLLQEMTEEGSFDETQILELLRETLPILQFLHAHKTIHRDVKPTNLIRRSRDQCLVLVDFAAMKHATQSAIGKTGTVLGSAEYVAPEQLVGRAIFASDLYSLGVTCVHLLTGLSPFELFDSHSNQWFWRSVAGTVSDRLSRILDRLLCADVSDRYQTATAVLQDLEITEMTSTSPIQVGSFATASRNIPETQCWQKIWTFTTATEVNAIAICPDEQTLIGGGNDGIIQAWSLVSGELQFNLEGQAGAIVAIALAPNGQTLASSSWDHTIRLWNLEQQTTQQVLSGHTAIVTGLAFCSDGQTLVSGSRDQTICLWDIATGKCLKRLTGHQAAIEAIALSSNHPLIASSDSQGAVKVWHLGTYELLRTLSGHTASVPALAICPESTAIAPNRNELIISGSWDMTIKLRNINTGGLRHTLSGHLLPVNALALCPNKVLATGSHDTTVKLWDLASGRAIATLSGHTKAVESVAVSTDGSILASASQDGTIRVYGTTHLNERQFDERVKS